ncbi:major facilitator superfamily domain-containing protein [Kockiozyma suomiensis]|uniref:major facilitator superfamily domain-containing protein n=1 Tax=Kockiozyma suomiensis TaxID=1337062 RepID=UPI003343230A
MTTDHSTSASVRDSSGRLSLLVEQSSIIAPSINDREIADSSASTLAEESGTVDEKMIEEDYPEGGLAAWTVVFGAWCAMLAVFGVWNSVGVFQAYLVENDLAQYDEGTISWIFSTYSFLFFFCGVQVGPVFDKYGAKPLVICGSVGSVAAVMIFSLCHEYYQYFLSFAILGGISGSMIFTPAVAVAGQWFKLRRGLATGIAATGGSFGGILFPLLLRSLIPKIGFAWAVRVIGFFVLFFSVFAVLCVKSRFKGGSASRSTIDLRAFKDRRFAFMAVGNFLLELALLIPSTYFITFAISKGVDEQLAYTLTAIMNAASVFGRWLPGYVADKFGTFNMLIVTVMSCGLLSLGIWAPIAATHGRNFGGAITYLILFGFASGSGISLAPVCFSQICDIKDYGKRYGTAYSLASIGSLIGVPIGGEILRRMDGNYTGLVAFCGAAYMVSSVCLVFARGFSAGWKLTTVF